MAINLQPAKIEIGATNYPEKHNAAVDALEAGVNAGLVELGGYSANATTKASEAASSAAAAEASQELAGIKAVEADASAGTAGNSATTAAEQAVIAVDAQAVTTANVSEIDVFLMSHTSAIITLQNIHALELL